MRYAMALLLALGIGIAATSAAVASDNTDGSCYTNGVAHSCFQPAPVYLGTGAGPGVVAGPTTPDQTGSYVQQRYENMGR